MFACATAGCSSGAGSSTRAADGGDTSGAASGAECVPPDDEAPLAVLEGDACPWILERSEGSSLRLRELSTAARVAVGESPLACREMPCEHHGVVTPAGPVLVVEVPSAHSELPREVWLGLTGAGRLELVPLWPGPAVLGDGTDLGPVWSLEPHVCGDRIALFALRRFDVGGDPELPADLASLQGYVQVVAGGLEVEPVGKEARARCAVLPVVGY